MTESRKQKAESRTALVTGAGGGLGPAVVQAFLDDGWRVVAAVRSSTEEREGVEVVQADLFDPDAVAAALERAGPGLRAVVNLAGGYGGSGRVHETPVDDFDAQMRLNLRPTFLVTRAALPTLLAAGGGTVVCFSSRAAVRPFAGASGYIAAKAAVIAFAQAVAAEYRDDGVRCNAILPSVIDTPSNRASQPDADHSRWVSPEEIARVVLFLSTTASAPVSGAVVPVYGRA